MSRQRNQRLKDRRKQRNEMWENRPRVVTNGTLFDPHRDKVKHNLSMAMELLINDGTVLNLDGLTTIATMTEDIFHALGTSILEINWNLPRASEDYNGVLGIDWNQKDMKKFTLVGAENKDEGIDNPNIFDPDIKNLVPKLISVEDKFIDKCDPLYEQDEELPESRKDDMVRKRHKQSLKLAPVIDKLCSLHMNMKPSPKGMSYTVNKYLNSKDKSVTAPRRRN